MTGHVYVSRRLTPGPMAAIDSLGKPIVVHPDPDRPPRRSELLEGVRGASALVTLLTEQVDSELLDAAGDSLRIVANCAVGYDNVDVSAAASRGVIVTNTPGVLDEATADCAFGLILATSRRLVEADRFVRTGRDWVWGPQLFVGLDVSARATLGVEPVELGMLLRESDIVSLHCPLTPETRHLIGDDELAAMKSSGILVNTARGPIVDESALVHALKTGGIGGAGLDVYEQEPRPHPGLFDLENVVLLPHVGSAGEATRDAMGQLAVENVRAVLGGERPLSPVGA